MLFTIPSNISNAQILPVNKINYAPSLINPSLIQSEWECVNFRFLPNNYRFNDSMISNFNLYSSLKLKIFKSAFNVNYLSQTDKSGIFKLNKSTFSFGGKIFENSSKRIFYGINFSNTEIILSKKINVFSPLLNQFSRYSGINLAQLIDNQRYQLYHSGFGLTLEDLLLKEKNYQIGLLTGASFEKILLNPFYSIGGNKKMPLRVSYHLQAKMLKKDTPQKWVPSIEGLLIKEGNYCSIQSGLSMENYSKFSISLNFQKSNFLSASHSNYLMSSVSFYLDNKKNKTSTFKSFWSIQNGICLPQNSQSKVDVGNQFWENAFVVKSNSCDQCFQKPIKYDKSFTAKTQKFWRRVFKGDGVNTRKTDCTQFINN